MDRMWAHAGQVKMEADRTSTNEVARGSNDRACPAPGAFARVLWRQRAHADRTGSPFLLLRFHLNGGLHFNSSAEGAVDTLMHVAAQECRSGDLADWFGDHRRAVGVILPDASAESAPRVIERVTAAFRTRAKRYADAQGVIPELRCEVYVYPSTPEMQTMPGASGEKYLAGETLFSRPLPRWKRALDIVASGTGLALLSPLFLVVAIFIKIVSPGPVFFRQERVGRLGITFRIWKFRTMFCDSDVSMHQEHMEKLIQGQAAEGGQGRGIPMTKIKHDPRIIPFGHILRASCIDELPQLINVLLGDMTLIGPRPALPYEADQYLRWHTGRFDAVPGMTGLWQVSGKNTLSFEEMVSLDIRYGRELSIWQDAKILVKTIPTIWAQVRAYVSKRRANS